MQMSSKLVISWRACLLLYTTLPYPPHPLAPITSHRNSFSTIPILTKPQADSASSNCDSPTCRSSFGIFLRRHHCRHCGHVFCASHTPHLVPLDQNARFHPEGVPSRACDLCWSAHQRWEETRSDRLNKIQNNMDAQVGVSVPDSEHIENQESKAQSTEVAASVPRDWNWSTF